jgi:hypothetical protein
MRFRRLWAPLAALAVIALTAVPAQALPSTQPDATDMVNGMVRAIAQVGNRIWIGGAFSEVLDQNGNPVKAVKSLAAFNDTTGALDTTVHIPSVTAGSGTAVVYDMSIGPSGSLYIAGHFSAVDGAHRSNVAAIDPTTGTVLPFAPSAPSAFSVYAGTTSLYVGGGKLLSYQYNGSPTPGYTAPIAYTDSSLRGHVTKPNFRDITAVGNTLVSACQCDSIKDSTGTHAVKAVVEINGTTGNLLSWRPGGLSSSSAAFGISAIVQTDPANGLPTVYLAAGGSDFTAAYDFASGAQRWKTDTSGSSQAIDVYQGDMVIGGHFDWTAKSSGQQCGSNSSPNTNCYHSPKLVAMNAGNGQVILISGQPWNPGICCLYNGVWVVHTDSSGTSLHVGGEFTKAGGQWSLNNGKWTLVNAPKQEYYARFSN